MAEPENESTCHEQREEYRPETHWTAGICGRITKDAWKDSNSVCPPTMDNMDLEFGERPCFLIVRHLIEQAQAKIDGKT